MAKKKVSERYKPFRSVRIPLPLYIEVLKIAERKYSTPTEQIKLAVVEFVERNGVKPG